MDIVKEQIDDLNAVLKVNVKPEDYQDDVMSQLRDYARQAKMPGFRPGKVPVSLIKRMYGKSILFDQLNKMLSQRLHQYIHDENLSLLGNPLPRKLDTIDLDIDKKQDYEFEYEIGLVPDFKPELQAKEPAVLYEVEVDDELMEKEISRVLDRYGAVENPEVSEEGDVVYGKITQLDENGNIPEEGARSRMLALNAERIPSKEVIKEIPGKKEGDSFDITMDQVFKDRDEAKRFWEYTPGKQEHIYLTNEQLDEIMGGKYRFEVRKVTRVKPAELNQELFDKMFGEGKVSSEEEFRTELKKELEKHFENEAKRFYRAKTVDKLIDQNEIPLPEEFLKKWLVETNEKVTEENVDHEYDHYQKMLRWQLIVEKLRQDNPDLDVKDEEMRERAKEVVGQHLQGQFGESPDLDMNQFIDYYLQDEKFRDNMYHEILDQKIFDHVMTVGEPKKDKITATKFLELK